MSDFKRPFQSQPPPPQLRPQPPPPQVRPQPPPPQLRQPPPQQPQPQEQPQHQDTPFDLSNPGNVVLIAGSQGSGKTNAVRWSLLKHTVDNPIYDIILVFTKTKFDGEYDFVPDDMVVSGYKEKCVEKVLGNYLKTY